jgi:hypothetical protein
MESKEAINSVDSIDLLNVSSNLIQDNKILFSLDDKTFSVRMPNQLEQALTEQQQNLMQLEYMKQPGCITRKRLLQQLRENQVIDIDEIERQKEILGKELRQIMLLLATKFSEDVSKIEEYTQKINEIKLKLQELTNDITTYLSPSMESRLEKCYIEYLTYLCTDTFIEEKWNRTWNSFSEFQKADTRLTNKALINITWLLLTKRSM